MKQLILDCDFLGKKQHFLIANNSSYHTYIGAILSIIIVIIMISLITYFGLEVIFRNNLNLISTKNINEDPPFIYLNNQSFMIFTLALENPDYSVYINETIYTLNVSANIIALTGKGQKNITTIPLQVRKCSSFVFTYVPEYFSLLDLDNLYCTELSDDIYLKGEYGKSEWAYLSYEFHKCVNSSNNNNSCMSAEEIEHRLQGGYLGMFFSDLFLLPENYSQPIKVYGKNIFTSFTGDQYTDVWFYLKSVELNTDTGLLFRNIKTEEFISYDYHISNKDNREGSNFISLFIRIGQNKETYYRSYRKLQVVTAEVGGMINLLLVCGEFISYYFREILYKDFILGFCYDNNNNNNKTGNKVKEVVYSGKNTIGKFNVQQQQQQQQQVCKQNSFDITIPGVINNNNNNNSSNNGNNSSLLSIHTIGVKNCFNNNDSCCVKSRLNLHTWNNNNNSSCSGNGSKYNQQQLRKSQTFQFRRRFDKDLNTWQLVLIVCNGKVRKRIKNVNYKFQQIGLLFDVIQFLKLNEDVNMIQKYYCNELYNNDIFGKFHFHLRDTNETDKYYDCLQKRKKGPLFDNNTFQIHSLRECQSQIRI